MYVIVKSSNDTSSSMLIPEPTTPPLNNKQPHSNLQRRELQSLSNIIPKIPTWCPLKNDDHTFLLGEELALGGQKY